MRVCLRPDGWAALLPWCAARLGTEGVAGCLLTVVGRLGGCLPPSQRLQPRGVSRC